MITTNTYRYTYMNIITTPTRIFYFKQKNLKVGRLLNLNLYLISTNTLHSNVFLEYILKWLFLFRIHPASSAWKFHEIFKLLKYFMWLKEKIYSDLVGGVDQSKWRLYLLLFDRCRLIRVMTIEITILRKISKLTSQVMVNFKVLYILFSLKIVEIFLMFELHAFK